MNNKSPNVIRQYRNTQNQRVGFTLLNGETGRRYWFSSDDLQRPDDVTALMAKGETAFAEYSGVTDVFLSPLFNGESSSYIPIGWIVSDFYRDNTYKGLDPTGFIIPVTVEEQ